MNSSNERLLKLCDELNQLSANKMSVSPHTFEEGYPQMHFQFTSQDRAVKIAEAVRAILGLDRMYQKNFANVDQWATYWLARSLQENSENVALILAIEKIKEFQENLSEKERFKIIENIWDKLYQREIPEKVLAFYSY